MPSSSHHDSLGKPTGAAFQQHGRPGTDVPISSTRARQPSALGQYSNKTGTAGSQITALIVLVSSNGVVCRRHGFLLGWT
jgi:hypothetical protein